MNYKDLTQEYCCDNCKKEFVGKDATLVDPINNISISPMISSFKFVDKNGIITGGREMAKKCLGDKLLACPHCGDVHLFGFDAVKCSKKE